LLLFPFHALPPMPLWAIKINWSPLDSGVFRMATKKIRSPSNIPSSLDGDQRISIAIQHTGPHHWMVTEVF
jgi:hypothetical protein